MAGGGDGTGGLVRRSDGARTRGYISAGVSGPAVSHRDQSRKGTLGDDRFPKQNFKKSWTGKKVLTFEC